MRKPQYGADDGETAGPTAGYEVADLGVTAGPSATATFQSSGYVQQTDSIAERVEKWFIQPLRAMKEHDGFIVLMVLLPLYEKHLRFNKGMGGRNFSQGDRIFETIGSDMEISPDEAYRFWQQFRNGVLHRALPKNSQAFAWAFDPGQPVPIKEFMGIYFINPFVLRDKLLVEIEKGIGMWNEDQICPLPSVSQFIG